MSEYHVTWEIDLDAGSPEEAATLASIIQRDPASLATIFTVTSSANKIDTKRRP